MIILGIVLIIIGWALGIGLLALGGFVLLVIGAFLALTGTAGGRRWY